MGTDEKSLRPYLSELGVFLSTLRRMREAALHEREQMSHEITELEGEITGRRRRIQEQEEIIARCDQMLDAPAPDVETAPLAPPLTEEVTR